MADPAHDPRLIEATEQHRAGAFDAAEALYRAVLADQPQEPNALHLLGVVLGARGALEEGAALIRQALRIAPLLPGGLWNLGELAQALGRHDEALSCFNRLVARYPQHTPTQTRRAIALHGLGRLDEALDAIEQVLRVTPAAPEALSCRGVIRSALGQDEAALADYEAVTAQRHDDARAHFSASLTLLLLGDYARGLPRYEWRFRANPQPMERSFGRPQWFHRDSLEGMLVLLHAEQGLGDSIMFARYAPLMAARGARVILEVPAPLVGLMSRLEGVAQVVATGEALPDVHMHAPLPTLPLEFGTRMETIPAAVPYLRPDPARVATWADRLGPKRRLRIGLAWSGNPDHGNPARQVPLARLAPLLALDADFFALQTQILPRDLPAMAGLAHPGADFTDFEDTAAVASLMDLVISADTSIAHLAGALGLPLWIMLPFAPDWRWLRHREDSPWYPTARLFRQAKPGDWQGVATRLAAALAEKPPV